MSNLNGLQAELLTLCGMARDGSLTAEQFARLESILRDSAEARELYVQFVQLNSYLIRQGGPIASSTNDETNVLPPVARSTDTISGGQVAGMPFLGLLDTKGFEFPGFGAPSALASSLDSQPENPRSIDTEAGRKPQESTDLVRPRSSHRKQSMAEALAGAWVTVQGFFARPLPLAACASILSVLAVLGVQQRMRRGEESVPPVADALHVQPAYVATLVNVTNCRWDKARSTADVQRQSALRAGESLHLLEGVAEITSSLPGGGAATIQLEGPLAMMLTSEGMPSLLYGRMTGLFTCDFDQFTLDTPLGRVLVSGDASIGVTAAANDVELHVFSGVATLELWGMGSSGAPEQVKATAGNSLRVRVVGDGKLSVDRGKSRENWFVTPAAIAASRLPISDEYVAAIREAKPIAYWRFEDQVDGMVRNEAGDRLHCRMVGDAVRLRSSRDSRTVEFGLTAGPGYLISDDVLDGVIGDNYSLEAWVKPTYYHHGALFSLIAWSPMQSPAGRHRFLLEICGPVSGYHNSIRPSEIYPGRIRFINYTVDCFSASSYVVRKWQLMTAVKQGAAMRLYADGRLVGTAEDPAPLGNGLRVLMGQLFPPSPLLKDEVTSRLFVGELDEVALYDRPLTEDEIQRHLHLGRPDADAATEARNQKSF